MRGASLTPVWGLPPEAPEGVVAVGAAESCDWRILADGVPALAFYLKAIADQLFVRASGAAELRLDGHAVGSIWTPVEQGARLAVGEAVIEIGLSGRSRTAQSALLRRTLAHWVEREQALRADAPAQPSAVPVLQQPAAAAPALREQPAAGTDDLDAWERPSARTDEVAAWEQAAAGQDQVAPWSVRVSSEQLWSATIFGPDEGASAPSDGEGALELPLRRWPTTSLWIAGSLVACAYGCWILLLDHF